MRILLLLGAGASLGLIAFGLALAGLFRRLERLVIGA